MRIVGSAWRLRGLAPGTPNAALGTVLTIGGCALLTFNDALMKALVAELPLGQVVSLRALAGCIALALVAPFLGGMRQLVPINTRHVALISGLLVAPLFLFPWTLRHIPLAEAIILTFLSPVVVVALSPWLLGEAVGWRRWSAVFVGLAGCALVVRPEGSFNWVAAVPIGIAVVIGMRDVFTRRWIHGERALALVFASQFIAFFCGLTTIPAGWVALTAMQGAMIVGAALLLVVSQVMLVGAFRHADAAVLSCLKYTSVIWAAALGWLIWAETPEPLDWAGAALIALSGVVISLRTRAKAPPPRA